MQIPHPRMRRPRAAAIPYLCRASKAALIRILGLSLKGPLSVAE